MNLHWCRPLALALVLSACATQPPRPAAPPAPPRPQVAAPAAPTKAATAAATSKPPVVKPSAPPEVKVVAPASYEQEKTRLKQALAKNTTNTLAPDDVGYMLDVLHGRLRQQIGKSTRITREADRIVIDLSGQLGPANGTEMIDAQGQQRLEALARVLVEYHSTFVSVLVRDGERSQPPDRRARALASVLTQAGVARQRLIVIGQDSGGANADAEAVTRVELLIEAIVREG